MTADALHKARMKILVTGGTGMLGSAILRLYHQQHDLHFIGRNEKIVKQLTDKYPVTGHVVDLSDQQALSSILQSVFGENNGIKVASDTKVASDIKVTSHADNKSGHFDAIIHCAAFSSAWGTYDAFYQANVVATENLLTLAKQHRIGTFVHISTTSVYFDFTDRWLISEQDPVAKTFCSDYTQTKYLAEQAVLANSHGQGLNTVILRPRGIYGPNDRALVPRLLAAVNGNRLLIPSAKNPVLDLTYVDNIADAALLACVKATSLESGHIFNISNDQPMPINDVLRQLLSALSKGEQQRPIKLTPLPYALLAPVIALNEKICRYLPHQPEPKITIYSAGLLNFHQTLNIDKAKQCLDYQANVSITEGIKRYVDWIKNKTI